MPISIRSGLVLNSWSNLDGSLGAPTGNAQYPNYFTNLNGISPYPFRPPWKVAGVDYRVGINTGVILKDPATINPSIATIGGGLGAGQNTNSLNIAADNVTLDGYDFTLSGGYTIELGSHTGCTILNSKLQNLCIFNATNAGTMTVKYCEINGLGLGGETLFGAITVSQDGVGLATYQYNWFRNAFADVHDLSNTDIQAKYNLYDTLGFGAGAHGDCFQWVGTGTANNIAILFNTYVHTSVTNAYPSSFIDLETQPNPGPAVMYNPEVGYNVGSVTLVDTTSVLGATNNGSGLVRLQVGSTATSYFGTGDVKVVTGVNGVSGANGQWLITVIDATHIDLQGTSFSGAYTSGGVITGAPSLFYRIGTAAGGTVANTYFHDNYADPTNMTAGVISDGVPGTGYNKNRNILLTTGGSF